MRRVMLNEAFERLDEIRESLEAGALVIFPTDTIYGVGCLASLEPALLELRRRKDRWGKPFSLIAPNKEWISENFDLNGHDGWLEKLPGPYTLVLEPKAEFSRQISANGRIGVRIPAHPIARLVELLGVPLVATSVNPAGMDPLTKIDELDDARYAAFADVAFAIDDGVKSGPASTVVDLTAARPVYLRM